MTLDANALWDRTCAFVRECPRFKSGEDLGRALSQTLEPFGFPAVASGRLEPTGEIAALHFAVWDPRWREIYEARGFLAVDPVPLWAASSGAPVVAGQLRARTPRAHPAQEVFRAGDALGLAGGFIAPQRSANNHPGVVAFIGPRDPEDAATRFLLCGLASVVYHRAEEIFARAGEAPLPAPHQRLTARERECLQHLVEGRTFAFAADAMRVSQATIRFHTRNLCLKTGSANRVQLAAIAIARGLVETGPSARRHT